MKLIVSIFSTSSTSGLDRASWFDRLDWNASETDCLNLVSLTLLGSSSDLCCLVLGTLATLGTALLIIC